MALYKEMITPKGVVVRYHKIAAIQKLSNVVFVQMSAYADWSYRLEEHSTDMDTSKFLEIQKKIVELKEKESLSSDNKEILEELIKEYRSMGASMFAQNTKKNAIETYGEFVCLDSENEDDISFSEIYKKLKETATYFGAEDC